MPQSNVKIVGAYVFPHGAITLDPDTRDFSGIPAVLPNSKEECIKLHAGMKAAAENLIQARPDVIIMSTPHGLTLQTEYLFIGNSKASGSAEWGGDWKNFTAHIDIDSNITKDLVKNLTDAGSPVELLTLGSETDPLNLRWGEVIPWWFINQAAQKAGVPAPKAIIFGQARNRANGSKKKIPELLQLGANVLKFLKGETMSGKRIAIVISSDLSHYHSKDPTSPYPYNENSTVFDKYITNWAGIDYGASGNWDEMEQNLLTEGGDLVDTIGSCGYTGLVFLHGLMKEHLSSEENSNFLYKAKIFYYSAPTYYGMLSSSWMP